MRTARVAPERQSHRLLAAALLRGGLGEDMAKMTYGEQLKHPNWQKKRLERLEASRWACDKCATTEVTLHVHHKRYFKGRMAWEYELDELQTLCEPCHANLHDREELAERVFLAFETRYPMLNGKIVASALLAGMASIDGGLPDEVAEQSYEDNPFIFATAALAGAVGRNRLHEMCCTLGFPGEDKWLERAMNLVAGCGSASSQS